MLSSFFLIYSGLGVWVLVWVLTLFFGVGFLVDGVWGLWHGFFCAETLYRNMRNKPGNTMVLFRRSYLILHRVPYLLLS